MICMSRRSTRKSRPAIAVTFFPAKVTLPVVGSISRRINHPRVLLPDPDSPTRPRVSPASMENETSSTARVTRVLPPSQAASLENTFVRLRASRRGTTGIVAKNPFTAEDARPRSSKNRDAANRVSIVVRSEVVAFPLLPLSSLQHCRRAALGRVELRGITDRRDLGEVVELQRRDPADSDRASRLRIRDDFEAKRRELLHGLRRLVGELELQQHFAVFIGGAARALAIFRRDLRGDRLDADAVHHLLQTGRELEVGARLFRVFLRRGLGSGSIV